MKEKQIRKAVNGDLYVKVRNLYRAAAHDRIQIVLDEYVGAGVFRHLKLVRREALFSARRDNADDTD